ncbi:LuxR C-terminal-related transcriptional regulator [Streptomyces sp. NPDC018045]|uniref:LuxR C-terminal-related transcriptional regulator n=1 Tax=Streptomyces sp. NPDC018045 TaxID=3365037 RepID=UPI0037B4CD90
MGSNARPLPQVRGRDRQLAQVRANLRRVASTRHSGVLVVEAAPGAGKSRLLREAVTLAGGSGFAVVNGITAGPATVSEGPAALAGARSGTQGSADHRCHAPQVTSVIESARTWLRNDSEHRRVLVVLDDLHLAPLPAWTALCELIETFSTRPALWLLAFSSDRDAVPSEAVRTCLGKLRSRISVEAVHELGPLSGEALTQLVTDVTGAAPGSALLALAESVDGTPRAVIELMRGLVEDGDVCVVDNVSRLHPDVSGGTADGDGVCLPAPVPKRFAGLLDKDLQSLSEPTLKALRVAAVLGSPFAPEDLSALLGQTPVALLAAVDEAVSRKLVVCGEHDLAFRSEPIWRVLLDSVPLPVRALLRRQAAQVLLSRRDGLARAALQLVHIVQPGDMETLRIVSEGSRKLLTADPSTAASLAMRCMELLPPGQAERLRCAKTAVEAFTRAGHLEKAVTLAEDTIDEATRLAALSPGSLAEDVAALRATMAAALLLQGDAPRAHRAAREALTAQEAGFGRRQAVIAHLAASWLTGDSTAHKRVQEILDAPGRHPQAVHVGAMAFHAFGRWRAGRAGDALQTLRQAVALGGGDRVAQFLDPRWFLAFTLTRLDEYQEAQEVVECCAPLAAAQAGTPAAAVAAVLRAPLYLAQGRLEAAEQAARDGVGAAGPCVPMLAPQAWLVLALTALRRGALPQAEDHLKTLEKDFPTASWSPWWAARLLLNAQLAEARSDFRAAAEILAEIASEAGALRELALEDPAAAAWCVRCALAADRPDLARAVIEATEDLRQHNRGVPAVLAAALHARALADKDADALDRAGRLHRNPWAQAAVAEDQAVLLLDRGDQENAVSALDRALGAYGALGGEHDAARVRARLRRLGVRRRHWTRTERPVSGWESLTKTERKVAELVAGGLTNGQAARHLFISPHTVGFHLRQIYRKLGIRSRTALTRFTL